MIPRILKELLCQDGFIVFVEGKKGSGKTNFSMFLMELCHDNNFRELFATNIACKSDYVRQITNYPELQDWLINTKGKKMYVLDEAGKHIKKMRFMTDQNVKFFDLLQLIRHYDCGFIGIAPSSVFIDSMFLNTDILDARMRKLSRTTVKVLDFTRSDSYYLHDVPKSKIKHDTKDIAIFDMKGSFNPLSQPCCEYAKRIIQYGGTLKANRSYTPIKHPEQGKRLLQKHLEHTLHSSQATHEDSIEDNDEKNT